MVEEADVVGRNSGSEFCSVPKSGGRTLIAEHAPRAGAAAAACRELNLLCLPQNQRHTAGLIVYHFDLAGTHSRQKRWDRGQSRVR